MAKHPLAGKPAPKDLLVDIDKLLNAYDATFPDPSNPVQKVSFGTSGHRGTSFNGSFTEGHIASITQAICEYRKGKGIRGPLYMGKDTHALSEPAQQTALEVLAANAVDVVIQEAGGYTPTPVISHAILSHNKGRSDHLADGIIITPSHNPPADGGFKYNPPRGGPADTETTQWIQNRANELLSAKNNGVKRVPYERALLAATTHSTDLSLPYIKDLGSVVRMDAIKEADLKLGADPLGGSAIAYWPKIADIWGIDVEVTNTQIDPTFSFMTVDHDGKIRMDCSSPDAMASLIAHRERFDIAFGNDPDADRHGIVTKSYGLMDPNQFLCACIAYLYAHRSAWSSDAKIGKTIVSSSLIDRVGKKLGREVQEVPVGFKWFVEGLFSGTLGFGGEESAGASFLKIDGSVWSTDKDGIIMDLLAAEMTAVTGKDPAQICAHLNDELGKPFYTRVDAPADAALRAAFKKLTKEKITAKSLAAEPIEAILTNAPGNGEPFGGVKVSTANGWFAARPSGTEDIYKIYAESFVDSEHLAKIVAEAQRIIGDALRV